MEAAAKPRSTYLVEHYWPGLTFEVLSAATERVRAQAEAMTREGLGVRYLRSTMVPGDEAAFCVFEASSSALVGEAYTRAGVGYERIVGVLELDVPVRLSQGDD